MQVLYQIKGLVGFDGVLGSLDVFRSDKSRAFCCGGVGVLGSHSLTQGYEDLCLFSSKSVVVLALHPFPSVVHTVMLLYS